MPMRHRAPPRGAQLCTPEPPTTGKNTGEKTGEKSGEFASANASAIASEIARPSPRARPAAPHGWRSAGALCSASPEQLRDGVPMPRMRHTEYPPDPAT